MTKSLLLVAAIICGSCQQPAADNTRLSGDMEAEIRSMFAAYSDAVRKHGLPGELPFLDSSSRFFWVPPGYGSALSYDSVARILRANAPLVSSINNRYEEMRIVPLSEDAAAYTAKITAIVTSTQGVPRTRKMLESGVVIKRGGSWKLLCGQTALIPE